MINENNLSKQSYSNISPECLNSHKPNGIHYSSIYNTTNQKCKLL